MRFTRFATLLLFAALTVAGLSACDQGSQNFDYEKGENLSITAPADQVANVEEDPSTLGIQRFAPVGESTFNIFPFTIEKDYEWSVEGPDYSRSTRRDGEYLDVTFNEPGDYTITVDDGEYTGSVDVEAVYADVATQASRAPLGLDVLGGALGTAGLSDTLATEGPFTLLAPSNDALVAMFDEDAEGDDGAGTVEDAELPAEGVLSDILQYHVIPGDSLLRSDLMGEEETLAGSTVSFSGSGEGLTIEDGSAATEPASIARANVPATNGVVHVIDNVLLPPTASVAFNDQTATDSVNVHSVYLPDGGFVAIHDSTLTTEGDAVGSVIGVSEYLEAGIHNSVPVALFNEDLTGASFDQDALQEGQTLIAMPHQDDGDGEY